MARPSAVLHAAGLCLGIACGCARGTELPGSDLSAAPGIGGASTSSTVTGAGGAPASTSSAGAGDAATSASSASSGATTASSSSSSTTATSSSSSSGGTCAHSDCTVGSKLVASCDPCVTEICAARPSCCASQWGLLCVDDVETVCGLTTCGTTTTACAHSQCTTGAALKATCDACATAVCDDDPYCCAVEWDAICVAQVAEYCTTVCP